MTTQPPEDPAPAGPTLIEPRNELREKVGGPLQARHIRTADQAVAMIAGEFGSMLGESLTALLAARRELGDVVLTQTNTVSLFKQALELKSMGTLCGYPLATRVAHSLCRLLLATETEIPLRLVDAHVDTLRAVLHGGTASTSDPTALALVAELETQVAHLKGADARGGP